MAFDWPKAIERNLDDLIAIVTRLFVLAGIRTGRCNLLLPRMVRTRILSVLRPAEFAARRLIVMAACGLVTKITHSAGKRGKPPRTSVIVGPGTETGEAPDERLPAFTLFDPLKPLGHPWLEEDGFRERQPAWPQPFANPNELVDARAISRRIQSLEAALQDIEGQAKRLARWRARRHRATTRPQRWRPIRPGLPPGWRKRPKTAVEEVLKECHSLALYAWNTS